MGKLKILKIKFGETISCNLYEKDYTIPNTYT